MLKHRWEETGTGHKCKYCKMKTKIVKRPSGKKGAKKSDKICCELYQVHGEKEWTPVGRGHVRPPCTVEKP